MTIGRIVHIPWERKVIPAIVTAVHDAHGTIAATAFPVGAQPVTFTSLDHDEVGGNGTWHWPARS